MLDTFKNILIENVSSGIEDIILQYIHKTVKNRHYEYSKFDNKYVGTYISYHRNGNQNKIIQYVNGLKQNYKIYNADGILVCDRQYKNGNKTGLWTSYYDNGNPQKIESYKNGFLDGESIYFYYNGNISQRKCSKNGQPHGKMETYYPNGKLLSVSNFVNGLREQYTISYTQDGEIKEEGYYKNDLFNGTLINYHGKTKTISNFKDGKYHGNQTKYEDNVLVECKEFIEDKINGFYIQFYPNGNIKSIGMCKDGLYEGELVQYYINGSISLISRVQSAIPLETMTYLDNGNDFRQY